MNAKNRNDLLYALVQNYVLDKYKNQVLMRENNIAYVHSKGMLQGACMAFECEIVETESSVTITTRKGKQLVAYQLD